MESVLAASGVIPFMVGVCFCPPVWIHHRSHLFTTAFNQRYSSTWFPALRVVTSNTFTDLLKSDKLSHSWLEENKEFQICLPESWRNTCVCFHRETPRRSYHHFTGTRNIFPVLHQDNFNSASPQLLKTVKILGWKTQSAWPECTSHTEPRFHYLLLCLFTLYSMFAVIISYS